MFAPIRAGLVAGALATICAPALAGPAVEISIFRPVTEAVMVDGDVVETEVLKPVVSSIPGERLTYQISLENAETTPAQNITMVLPIDEHVTFVEGSLSSTIPLTESFSVDGGKTFGDLSMLTVQDGDELRPARVDDLDYMTLFIPALAAGARATIAYTITVD